MHLIVTLIVNRDLSNNELTGILPESWSSTSKIQRM